MAIAAAVGIVMAESITRSGISISPLIFLLAAIGLGGVIVVFSHRRFSAPLSQMVAVVAMCGWALVLQRPPEMNDVATWAPRDLQPIVLRGEVTSVVQRRRNPLANIQPRRDVPDYQSIFKLRLLSVRDRNTWESATGHVRTLVQGDVTNLLVGDRVKIFGRIVQIGAPSNPGEPDLRSFYRSQGIGGYLMVDAPRQITDRRAGRSGPMRMLSWFSNRGDTVLTDHVGEHHGALAAALVLGRRGEVDPQTRDLLVETGTVHLLSVSGLHLALIACFARWLVTIPGWSRGVQIVVVLSVCFLYAALTGGKPPVVRASVLVAAVLIGTWTSRLPTTMNSLALAAIALMIMKPQNLLDTGAQLSFVAVATLIISGRYLSAETRREIALDRLSERARSSAARIVNRWWAAVKQMAVVSFWVWAITTPMIWHTYHIVSPISVIANLVVVPMLGVTLSLGILTIAAGLISTPLAILPGYACSMAIGIILACVNWFAEIPGGYIWLPSPPTWVVIVFYVGLVALAIFSGKGILVTHRFSRLAVLWIGLWTLLATPLALRWFESPVGSLTTTFIDVGHGTSVLIELPDGAGNWLYDAGRLGDPVRSIDPIESVLWSRGIRRLDGVVISHADADHYNAIPALIDRFAVSRIYTTAGLIDQPQPGLQPVRHAIRHAGIAIDQVHAGDQLQDRNGAPWAKVLHPPQKRLEGSDNANSIVLLCETQSKPLLLPGDLEIPGTEHLLDYPRPKPGGVMMSPHHGSLQQDVRPLLDWMRPAEVIVSCGERGDSQRVRSEQSQTGGRCSITASLGAIQVRIESLGTVHCRRWNVDHWEDLD
jgi:competence protein ComEC